jgi:hypothetical protein
MHTFKQHNLYRIPVMDQSITRLLFSKIVYGVIVLTSILILPGCATYSSSFNTVEREAANHNVDGAIKALDSLNLSGSDEVLHYLNKGTLLSFKGDFAASNKYFDQAKILMEHLSAISVTEQVASVTVNDTMKAYEGLPSEQLMVYSFEALNYLQMGNVDDAAVEARQFDVKQRLIAEKNSGAKYLSGAFVRYLNGMIYEASGNENDARIDMEKAVEGYAAQGSPVPNQLRDDLARLNAGKRAPSEVVFILHNGLGASIDEHNIRVVNPFYDPRNKLDIAMFSLALPKFVKRSLPVSHVVLTAGTSSATSEVVEDVNEIAEKSFNDRLPTIQARAVARLVAKNILALQSKKKMESTLGSFAFLGNLATDVAVNATERADTRSWSLLPGNIQMARLALPPGKYDVTATYYGSGGYVLGTRVFPGVEVRKNKVFISDFVLNPPAPPKSAN